jgi:hypothetical protein
VVSVLARLVALETDPWPATEPIPTGMANGRYGAERAIPGARVEWLLRIDSRGSIAAPLTAGTSAKPGVQDHTIDRQDRLEKRPSLARGLTIHGDWQLAQLRFGR